MNLERFDCVLGAIIGDIIGAPYEFGAFKKKEFPLFGEEYETADFTDDTVLTVAVFDAMKRCEKNDFFNLGNLVIDAFHNYGALYPNCGFGSGFRRWVSEKKRTAYNSW